MTEYNQPGSAAGLPPTPPQIRPRLGPEPLPTNEAEALEIGQKYFPEVGSPGGPSSLYVHEFDIGYLIHAGWPTIPDSTGRPSSPGGSNIVISKIDGQVASVPNFPEETAVQIYRKVYRPNGS
ncbi:hypothetical protein [Streptomyces tubercidicus]|uniref:hypothetical protein n=1 Tax=Streptomyces tubercidicus TaxID=47759 RepID=UPI0034668753